MLADVVDLLRCPGCGTELAVTDRVLGCRTTHRYDIAKQGYVNLLSTPAGANADTAEMITAREGHLSRGHHDAVRELLVARSGAVVLDAGAGPGWYLAGLPDTSRGLALDLSVAAARRAARVDARVGAVVCDLWGPLPVDSGVIDTVWCVFAPRNFDEYARVLRPGGELIMVIPGADHLHELVSAGLTIGVEPAKEERLQEQLTAMTGPRRLVPRWREQFRTEAAADAAAVADVIGMGPSAHHPTTRSTAPLPSLFTVSLTVLGLRVQTRG
ncbi:putative RNA methyltransferase [Microlunatus sp. Y2014]|uniref:putative RNA methyltransferase n=1 Tax=Microlunatus sp. Y2014 TaxID=3418488 RepID=UPI003DA6DF94